MLGQISCTKTLEQMERALATHTHTHTHTHTKTHTHTHNNLLRMGWK